MFNEFETELLSEATHIIDFAESKNVTLRLIGAIAIRIHSETARKQMARKLTDLDYIGLGKDRKKIEELFKELEYVPDWPFNTLHPTRLKFDKVTSGKSKNISVDVWLDSFEMCHKFDFTDRLHLDKPTVPITDLLMTKLQIIQLNEKDVKDIFSLFLDHELGESDNDRECINVKYMQEICGRDWGVYKTFTTNINKISSLLDSFSIPDDERNNVKLKLSKLDAELKRCPKNLSWKLRAIVGERMTWYSLPELPRKVETNSP